MNLRLIDSIKRKDGSGVKICLSTDDITELISMLQVQDENGHTTLHILCVPSKSHEMLFEWIIKKIVYLSYKSGTDPKDIIKKLITIENKALQNVLELTTKNRNQTCIDELGKQEIISENNKEYANKAIDAINKGLQLEDKEILFGGVEYENLAILQLVLESGDIARLPEKNQEGNTVFYIGAEKCHPENPRHIFTKILDNVEIQKKRLQGSFVLSV